jgi:hypothetical protein
MTEDYRERVLALIQAARDVRPRQGGQWTTIPPSHESLFRQYVADIRRAINGAHAWWNAMVKTQAQRSQNPAEAQNFVRRLNPVGPVADRGVIATVRKYWLACEALNQQLQESERVPPEEFVIGLLIEPPFEDIARFLSELPYWPLGMASDGRWI